LGVRPFEVPVSYHSRSIAMGKKITWIDGIECLQVLSRIRFGKATVSVPAAPAPVRVTRGAAVHHRDGKPIGEAAVG
jgi:hypothetical protein